MKGICTNWDCPKFDENGKIVQDIPDGENFVCQNPECAKALREVSDTSGGLGLWIKEHKLPVIIVVAVLAVATAAVLFLLFGSNKKSTDETPILAPADSTSIVIADTVKEQPAPIPQEKDTVYIVKDTTIYKTDTVVREKETVREVERTVTEPIAVRTAASKIYSFGSYRGDLKNGIPEGDGTMTYTRRVQIAKHDTQNPAHYAEAGDYFVGSWGNGDIVSGALYNKDGVIKERILAPKRFNEYDLSKD